jgi:hypothetical protein
MKILRHRKMPVEGDLVWLAPFEGSPRERANILEKQSGGMYTARLTRRNLEAGDDGLREFYYDQIESTIRLHSFTTNRRDWVVDRWAVVEGRVKGRLRGPDGSDRTFDVAFNTKKVGFKLNIGCSGAVVEFRLDVAR